MSAARSALTGLAAGSTVVWLVYPETFWLVVALWVAVIVVEIAWLVRDWRQA